MKTPLKILIGAAIWVSQTYLFALWTHIAPEGAYSGTGSSLEIASAAFMIASFIGVPILTCLWTLEKEKTT